jgi:glycerol-3-phosphate dehydrogenase
MTLGDVLLRRTAIGLAACQGLDRIDALAELVGGLLGWDGARRATEVEAYRREIAPMRRFSAP